MSEELKPGGEVDPFDSAELYTCDPEEEITESDPDEALRYYLDGCNGLPERVTVYAFRPKTVAPNAREAFAGYVLDELLRLLDDNEYGNPDDASEPSYPMHAKALAFVNAVLDEDYTVWACEQVASRE